MNGRARELLTESGLDYPIHDGLLAVGNRMTYGETKILADLQYPKSHRALCREDGSLLSIVGHRTQVFQNRDLAALADSIYGEVEELIDYRGNGTMLGYTVNLGEFGVGDGSDVTATKVKLVNSHDNSMSLRLIGYTERLICTNGMTGWASEVFHKITHVGNMAMKVGALGQGLLALEINFEHIRQQATHMARTPLGQEERQEFFLNVYTKFVGQPPAETKARNRYLKKATERITNWTQRMASHNQEIGGIGGTIWAALNAVTEDAQHGMGEAQWSQDFGRPAELKRIATRLAVEIS